MTWTCLQTSWPFLGSLTYFAASAAHPLLAGQPHSTMSCDCRFASYVHCPQCKVICHCVASALQTNVSEWHSSSAVTTRATTKVCPSWAFWSSSVRWQSCCNTNRLQCRETFSQIEISRSIQPNATLRKADMNNPPCLHACLWHKDTVLDHSLCACVSESWTERQVCYWDCPCWFVPEGSSFNSQC